MKKNILNLGITIIGIIILVVGLVLVFAELKDAKQAVDEDVKTYEVKLGKIKSSSVMTGKPKKKVTKYSSKVEIDGKEVKLFLGRNSAPTKKCKYKKGQTVTVYEFDGIYTVDKKELSNNEISPIIVSMPFVGLIITIIGLVTYIATKRNRNVM